MEVLNALADFKDASDLIVANRMEEALQCLEKLFTRDVFNRNSVNQREKNWLTEFFVVCFLKANCSILFTLY